jgi:hypothetical protein
MAESPTSITKRGRGEDRRERKRRGGGGGSERYERRHNTTESELEDRPPPQVMICPLFQDKTGEQQVRGKEREGGKR